MSIDAFGNLDLKKKEKEIKAEFRENYCMNMEIICLA